MSVEMVAVAAEESDIRLDRWFKRHYPNLAHGRLEKLLRKGQIRVDGKRAKANQRLDPGQVIRVPPMGDLDQEPPQRRVQTVSDEDWTMIQGRVLHRDDQVIVIDKPAGLATQGGTGMTRHLDGMLDALCFERDERPRLVHRLDKDTSGVLVLGRTAQAAAALAKAFKSREARKIYWGLVVGLPNPPDGIIKAPIAKMETGHGEKMEVTPDGQSAVTEFKVIEAAAKKAAWVQMEPRTGRTHQLRVHMAYLGTALAGDGKYGDPEKTLQGQVSRKLHLHARAIEIPHPEGGLLRVFAPLPKHMQDSFEFFDFDLNAAGDVFAREEED